MVFLSLNGNLSNVSFAPFRCSQIDNSVGRTCLSSNDMEPKELHKKRKHVDREDKISYYKPDAKILRSSKRSRKVLPRRSMRLITKVFLTFYSLTLQLIWFLVIAVKLYHTYYYT
jgi:hypothetical protein